MQLFRWRAAPLAFMLCLFAVGCSGSGDDLPELTPVEGVVTFDGKPLQGAIVTFVPAAGRPSNGTTDQQGHYELFHKPRVHGAVAGEHTVQITVEENMSLPANEQVTIPARYNTRSTLKVSLSGTEEVTHNFDLTKK